MSNIGRQTEKAPATTYNPTDLSIRIARLIALCPGMAAAHAIVGEPPVRRWPAGFEGLVQIVIGQQLSTASANAIYARVKASVVPLSPEALLATDTMRLKTTGLSAGKIATLRAVASAIVGGALDFEHLAVADGNEVISRLTAIRGIGPWTADIYLMFCRGDGDAFAPGDLALQIAAQQLLALKTRPTSNELSAIAEVWRPDRATAAILLWAYYNHTKAATKQASSPLRKDAVL